MKILGYSVTSRVKRKAPDKRIIISEKIIIIEYSDGRDLLVKKTDPRAINILKQVAL